jgi:hypothetical protein
VKRNMDELEINDEEHLERNMDELEPCDEK